MATKKRKPAKKTGQSTKKKVTKKPVESVCTCHGFGLCPRCRKLKDSLEKAGITKPTLRKARKVTRRKSAKKRLTPQEVHAAQCPVCKHKKLKEIEDRYLEGESPQDLSEDPTITGKLSRHTIWNHAKVFGLDKRRDNSTLKIVQRIIARAKINTRTVSDQLLSKCLELQSKLKGEIVERLKHEGEIGLKLTTDEVVDKRMKNLKKRLGEPVEEESDGTAEK